MAGLQVPTGFDASKALQTLLSLPEDQQAELMKRAMGQMGELSEKAQRRGSQEGMVAHFKEMRAKFLRDGGLFREEIEGGKITEGMAQVSWVNADAKPDADLPALRSLKPMIGAELEVGTTHRGRYLCGWVAVSDAFFGISSTSMIIEDVTGFLIEIAVYGLVMDELPPREKQHRVAAMFPKGKPIIIYEPYYKVRQDMSEGVRVDRPSEIVAWKDMPTDLESWKKLGNDFFSVLNKRNEGRGALSCYHKALRTVDGDIKMLAVLLNNLATCRFHLEDFDVATQLAGAAVHLDPTYLKGWYRLASSLIEKEEETQGAGESYSGVMAQRVVEFAVQGIPNLKLNQRQMLEKAISDKAIPASDDGVRFKSYAGWCVELASPGFTMSVEDHEEKSPPTPQNAESWRKIGSESFTNGDYRAAERSYLKGVSAMASSSCEVSTVLNNIAAVYLMIHREASGGAAIGAGASPTSIPNEEMVLLNCTVAGIIDPLNYKAWVRRARGLQKLDFTPEECIADLHTVAASVVTKKTSTAASNLRMAELKQGLNAEIQRFSRQTAAAKSVKQVSDTPTDVQREERDALNHPKFPTQPLPSDPENPFADIENEGEESIDAYIARMEMFDSMMEFGMVASKKGKMKKKQKALPREMVMYTEKRPAQLHIEFPKLRGWPLGIESTFARKVLYRACLNARSNPWITAQMIREGGYYKNLKPADMVKRWHGTGALTLLSDRSRTFHFGDIIDGRRMMKDVTPAYDARIRSNFANNPNRAEVYFFGTTHVAIGFNDFSSLLSAALHDREGKSGPLRFVGFEMSEFAVAKCKVVAEMLGSPTIPITSVMEVWLSSTWSPTTLTDFRKAVNTILASLRGTNENPKVLSYLNHWVSAETISAPKARSEFFLNLERYNQRVISDICSFRREVDRLALVQYILTGEVQASPLALQQLRAESSGGSANVAAKKKKHKKKKKSSTNEEDKSTTPVVGSLTMWNVPPGAPPLEEDIAFNTVNFTDLLDKYAKYEKSQKSLADRLSIADLFVIHILTDLQRLRDLMLANRLIIDVHYGVVKAVRDEALHDSENIRLLARIAALHPYTMSWSNVLDYFLPEDFHELARRCSVHGDCVHYGYSMNWPTQVFGASIMDYESDTDKELIENVLDAALGFPCKTQSNVPSAVDAFKSMGLDKLLVLPFHDNPLNSTGYVLGSFYRKYWVDDFMKKGELTAEMERRLGGLCTDGNRSLQQGAMELTVPCPLYRSSTTLFMSWCYDPDLRLHAAQNPFEISEAANPDMLAQMLQNMSASEKEEFFEDMAMSYLLGRNG